MINEKELQSLIALLDDSDQEIVKHVEERILSMGAEVIPVLENHWQTSFDAIQQQRIEQLIHHIQFEKLKQDLLQWSKSPEPDLLYGAWLMARYRYPDLDLGDLEHEIDRIKLDVWLEMHNVLSSIEKVKVLNHVIYNSYGFKGNTADYHAPQDSFLNNVLESKKGNPVSLGIIYSLVAQRLNLPVYGVNFPHRFLLAYKEENEEWHYEREAFNVHHFLDQNKGRILFYINPFNAGAILSKQHLQEFIRQIHLESRPLYFEPCTNPDIIKRVLRNIFHSYEKLEQPEKCDEVNEMLGIMGDDPLPYRSPKEQQADEDGDDDSQSDD